MSWNNFVDVMQALGAFAALAATIVAVWALRLGIEERKERQADRDHEEQARKLRELDRLSGMVGELADNVIFGKPRADAVRTGRRLRTSLITSGMRSELPKTVQLVGDLAIGEEDGIWPGDDFIEDSAQKAAAEIEAAFDR